MKINLSTKRISSFLTHFLLSHIILIFLPVLLITQVMFGGYLKVLEKEITVSNANMLKEVSSILDMKMKELGQTVVNFEMNSDLRPYNITSNYYRASKASDEIKKYMSSNGLLNETLFYIRGNDLLYSSNNTYNSKDFAQTFYKYSNMSNAEFIDYLENSKTSVILPSQEVQTNNSSKQLLTYISPVSQNSQPYATAVFLIDVTKIEKIIKDIFGSYNANTLIFDAEGKLLVSLYEDKNISYNDIYDRVKKDPNSNIIEANNGKYFLTAVKADFKGWSYISYCPFDEVMASAVHVKNTMTIMLLIVFVFGVIVVWFSITYNYLPIKRLFKKIEAKIQTPGTRVNNEILAIDHIIDELSIDNNQLREYIKENHSVLSQRLIRDLFKGTIPDMETFYSQERKSGLHLSGFRYATLIFLVEDTGKTSHDYFELIEDEQKALSNAGVEIYPLDVVGQTHLPVLITLTNEVELSEIVNKLHNTLIEKGLNVTAAVSPICNDPMDIALSYSQATNALRYRFVKGKNTVIFYESVSKESTKEVWYPKYEMEELVKNINGGNIEGINKIVKNVIAHIKQENMDIFAARCLCYDLINTVIKFVAELDNDFNDMQNRLVDVMRFSESETIHELSEYLESFCMELSTYVCDNKDMQTEQLLSYVKKHCIESDFSVRRMAEDLNMSYSYMSKYFHAKTGYSIMEYITVLRFEKVKQMLVGTDEPIKDIILAAGYIDIPNFSRKFKVREGMTPGQYRENYQGTKK